MPTSPSARHPLHHPSHSPASRPAPWSRSALLLGCLFLALGLAFGLGNPVTAGGLGQESPISPVSPLETVPPLTTPLTTPTSVALPTGPTPETGGPSLVLIGLILLGLVVAAILFLRRK